jgi:UDP-glucose 4-epimerase
MNCLVTGGAGFIGSHLVEELIRNGDRVRVLDNLTTGSMENLSAVIDQIDLLRGDIRDPVVVQQAVDGIDTIFHLAAHISVADSMKNPAICFDINVMGTNLLLQLASQNSVKKVVISSSAAVFGDQEILPIKEDATLLPLSPYGASKQMDEILTGMYSRSFHLPVTCLRYFNVFGPRQNPLSPYAAAIPIFIQRMLDKKPVIIFGDGNQTRDFIFVKDIARANLLAAANPAADGKIIDICSGVPTTINQLVALLRNLIQTVPAPEYQPARSGDIYDSYGSPVLAGELLGYEPSTSFEQGLLETIEWMRS